MNPTLEITTLRPAQESSADDFVRANADIDAYLRRQPGFLWRQIVATDDGRLIDIVAYDSPAHARAGAAGITGEMAHSPVHDTIDHETVDWQITSTLHRLA
ncbi:hypothetical protein [Streptomyces sp. NPDC059258]|uniref:hypothetical protein n=1 Tax=unclassified Streptomyces TaxID=2593676 RepID=UPI00368815E7